MLAHFSHVYVEGCSIYFTYALPIRGGVEAYERLWNAALGAAIEAGANVSHHHGSGQLKSRRVAEVWGGAGNAMVELRDRHDPDRILNPAVLADSTE